MACSGVIGLRRTSLVVCVWAAALASGLPDADARGTKGRRAGRGGATAASRSAPAPAAVRPLKIAGAHKLARVAPAALERTPASVRRTLRTLVSALRLHPAPRPGPRDRARITEERPYLEVVGSALGIDVGLTVSEIARVHGQGRTELVHVVGPDGVSHNLELVLARRELGQGQRLELQGPAINTRAGLPLGGRAIGVGLTSDLFEPGQRRALSYTLEAKLTERTLLYWAPLWAPGLAHGVDRWLGVAGGHGAAGAVAGALPFISAGLAVQSAWRAVRLLRDPSASGAARALATGHALADAVRVVLPLAGTLANVALVAASAGLTYLQVKRARGPPAATAP